MTFGRRDTGAAQCCSVGLADTGSASGNRNAPVWIPGDTYMAARRTGAIPARHRDPRLTARTPVRVPEGTADGCLSGGR